MMSEPLSLIVGLGNPGPEYVKTRHNAGFWLVQDWASSLGATFNPEKSFFGEVAKARYQGRQIWFAKPATFMNRSGQCVGALARFYKIDPAAILVLHDELDLAPGQLRLKQGGGHAGHNGLKDIQAALGDPSFWRLRIGIGHPRTLNLNQQVSDFVLHQPRQDEYLRIEDALWRCKNYYSQMIDGDMTTAMNGLHRDTD
jgi:PTH1 family peptidyl-tRNA hydrolase